MRNLYEDAYTGNSYPENDGEYSIVTVTKTDALEEDREASFNMYPNPVRDMLYINSNVNIKRCGFSTRLVSWLGTFA